MRRFRQERLVVVPDGLPDDFTITLGWYGLCGQCGIMRRLTPKAGTIPSHEVLGARAAGLEPKNYCPGSFAAPSKVFLSTSPSSPHPVPPPLQDEATTKRSRCPKCRRYVALTPKGEFRHHGYVQGGFGYSYGGGGCEGSGRRPEDCS